MSTPLQRSLAAALAFLALLSVPAARLVAQTAATTPVGFLQTQCLASSDTLVAPSFTRAPAFVGLVSSIAGNVVTLNATNLTTNQFVYNPSGSPAVTDNFYLLVGPTSAALTGTVSVTSGSATLTGSGTAFTSQLAVGNRISFNDGSSQLTYGVAAIASNTSLTLDRVFNDATATVTSALPATFDSSPHEGRWYTVNANSNSTVTVNLNGDTLSNVASGTQVSVIPFWSFNTVFPASAAGVSYTPTTSLHSLNTEILIPNFMATGTNISAGATYYYANVGTNVGWRLFTDSSTVDHGNDPILPDAYFIVSNNHGASSLPLEFVGTVPINKLATNLDSSATQAQDNAVGLNRPAAVPLGSLGLSPANGSFTTTTTPHALADQILLYNNAVVGHNKSDSALYFYYNNGWRLFTDSLANDHSADLIPAGSAITVRKAMTSNGQTTSWVNLPNY